VIGWKAAVDVVMVLAWTRTLVAVARRPAGRFRGRWAGKAAALAVAGLLYVTASGFFIPIGALAVWWRVVARGRDPFELPMADGRRMP